MSHYYMPTKVLWGKDILTREGEKIRELGNKPFIVTGKRSARISGALPDLQKVLDKTGLTFCHYDSIGENPELSSIHQAATLFKENKCDFLIGIGGGSPIDAAKAISVVAANDLQGRDIYDAARIRSAFPIVTIPTTAGTGTEVTPYSVITDTDLKKKAGFGNPLIFPVLSFCDPQYTISLPEKVTIDTALDALSHLLEGIYSKSRSELLFPLIFEGIKIITQTLDSTIDRPDDYILRERLLRASLYGGMVIAQGGTTLQHSIGYPLTTHYGLSHGLANGIVMARIMELFAPAVERELKDLFQHLGISRDQFHNWLENWLPEEKLALPGDFIESSAEEIMGSRNMAQNPLEITLEQIRVILAML